MCRFPLLFSSAPSFFSQRHWIGIELMSASDISRCVLTQLLVHYKTWLDVVEFPQELLLVLGAAGDAQLESTTGEHHRPNFTTHSTASVQRRTTERQTHWHYAEYTALWMYQKMAPSGGSGVDPADDFDAVKGICDLNLNEARGELDKKCADWRFHLHAWNPPESLYWQLLVSITFYLLLWLSWQYLQLQHQASSPLKQGGKWSVYSDPPISMTSRSGERKSEMIPETHDINQFPFESTREFEWTRLTCGKTGRGDACLVFLRCRLCFCCNFLLFLVFLASLSSIP